MLRIYLSSTREDLKDYREAAMDALRKAQHLVIDSYDADDEAVPEKCRADVRGADVYVGLFAWRYGWRPEPGGPSITEIEYRQAVESEKPCLVFLAPLDNWPAQHSDAAQSKFEEAKSLNDLRAELQRKHTVNLFSSPEELALKVTQAIHRHAEERAAQIESEKRSRSVQLGDTSNLMAPLPPPHPRQLRHGLLLVAVRGSDEAASAALADSLPKSWQARPFLFAPETGDDIPALDALALHARTAAVLLSPAGLQRLQASPAAPLLLRLLGDRLGKVHGILDRVAPAEIPADWGIAGAHPMGDWLATGRGSVSGELAGFCADYPAANADLIDPALIGLPWTVIAMTRAEAEALAANPQQIDDYLGKMAYKYFSTAVDKLGLANWVGRYGERRSDWRPFGGDQSIVKALEESVNRLNIQPVAWKRDHQALLGNRIRLRAYPFDPELLQESAAMKSYAQMRGEGCLVIADELSVLHPDLNPDARLFLGDGNVTVALISGLDPSVGPLDELIDKKSPLNIGAIRDRFDLKLDPCCEFGLNSPARLRRWLRVAIPETLAGGENRAADPDRRAEFRRLAFGGGQ